MGGLTSGGSDLRAFDRMPLADTLARIPGVIVGSCVSSSDNGVVVTAGDAGALRYIPFGEASRLRQLGDERRLLEAEGDGA
jgi:hypothetical protein